MNKKGEGNVKVTLSIIIVLLVFLFIALGFFIGFEFDTPIISKTISESNENDIKDEGSDEEEVTVESLLKSNFYFQDSVGVGSNFTNLYYFNNDGTFKYSSKTNVIANDQVVLASGTWEYNNEVLKLTYLEQQVSTNSNVIEDVVEGIIVTDYDLVKKEVQEVIEYDVELANADGMKYIDGDLILYYVALMDDEINEFFSE